MSRWPELRELTRHRTLSFLRTPEAVFWVFAFPIVLAAVLGFAFRSGEPAASRLAVLDADAGGALVARLEADPLVDVVRQADRAAAELALRSGRVDAFLSDPAADPPRVSLDPARPEAEVARLRVLLALDPPADGALGVDRVEETGSRYVDFLYPGLIGMNLMGTGLWSIGFAIADMRQRKVLKRLMVTPMRRSSLMASLLLSRMLFLVLEVLALTAFGAWVLGVPLRGALATYALLCVVGALSFAGLGLLAASRTRTIEGISGMLNLVMMPMWLGSGVFFSYERFPEAVQPALRVLPLTALNDALRAVMLEGSGLASVVPELAVMAAWTALPFFLALKVFRWS